MHQYWGVPVFEGTESDECVPEVQFDENFPRQNLAVMLAHPVTSDMVLLTNLNEPILGHLSCILCHLHDERAALDIALSNIKYLLQRASERMIARSKRISSDTLGQILGRAPHFVPPPVQFRAGLGEGDKVTLRPHGYTAKACILQAPRPSAHPK